MVPVFVLVMVYGGEHARIWAGIIYILASLTDVLDGYFARKLNKVTMLGRILDPLADKLMTAAVLVVLAYLSVAPWWVVYVYIAKEVVMVIGTAVLYKQASDVMPSNAIGKIAALYFFLTCAVLLLVEAIPINIANAMIIAALVLTIYALIRYIPVYLKFSKKN